eukprot:9855908-Ditylum_brightwellii.AAC.1
MEKHPDLEQALIWHLLQAMVYKQVHGQKKPKIEYKLKHFYHYLQALNPQACEAVTANIGGAPSKHWCESNGEENIVVSASVLDIYKSYKAIVEGTCPNYMIGTVDMTKEQIKAVLHQSKDAQIKVDKALEIKIVFTVFQQTPPRMPLGEIIAAQPQSANECSEFTKDALQAVESAVAERKNPSFLNFAIDGVLVETTDVMESICNFLS